MKYIANQLREHPAAIVAVGLVVAVLALGLWRSNYHARALQKVAVLQAELNVALGEHNAAERRDLPLHPASLEKARIFHNGIGPKEGQSLSDPLCTYVRTPSFAERQDDVGICESIPPAASSGDILCFSKFEVERADIPSASRDKVEGCLLTLWSDKKRLWNIKDVVIGKANGQGAAD